MKNVIFYPKTEKEAEMIQKMLFTIGVGWHKSFKVGSLGLCVDTGMAVENDRLYYNPAQSLKETFPVIDMSWLVEEELEERNGKKYRKEDIDKALALLTPVE